MELTAYVTLGAAAICYTIIYVARRSEQNNKRIVNALLNIQTSNQNLEAQMKEAVALLNCLAKFQNAIMELTVHNTVKKD